MQASERDSPHGHELIHCIYVSSATRELQPQDLEAILGWAHQHNPELGVTGILLYMDGSFMQVLEGEADVVDRLFDTIAHDQRHTGVTRIIREGIPHRYFAGWSMGFSRISPKDLDEIVGDDEFLNSLAALDDGRARRLLLAFREGRWRENAAIEEKRPPS